jgi:hypothetical protein
VDHVGVGALGAGRDDVVGWGHDAGEALLDRETGLAPGGEAAREVGDVLVAQVAEGGGERYDLLLDFCGKLKIDRATRTIIGIRT